MAEIKNLNLGREVLGGTLAKVVMALAGFVGTAIFARVLGPTTFGGVGIVITLVNLFDKPMAGWGLAGKKRISEDRENTSKILGAQIFGNLGWLSAAGLGVFLFSDILISYTGLQQAPLFLVALLGSVGIFSTFQSLLKGHGRISLATWIDTIRSYLTTPLQVGLILLGWGAGGMVFGLAFASVALIPVTLYFIGAVPTLPTPKLLRSLWSYAKYSIPSASFNLVYNRIDILVLATLLSPTAVGYYDVAWKLTLPVMFISQTAGAGLMSKISALEAADEVTNTDIINTLSFTGVLAIPAFVGVLLLHTELLVTIFGSEYASAGPLLIGLAAYRVVATQSQPLINALNGLDRPDLTMWITGMTVAGNVVLGVILTLYYGPIGVVAATFVSEFVRYVAVIVIIRREVTSVPPISRPVVEQVGAAVVMGASVILVKQFVTVVSWVDLAVLVGTGVVVYWIVLLSISKQLRNTLQSAVAGTTVDIL